MLENISGLPEEEFKGIYESVVAEKERREKKVLAYENLSEAVVAILPAIREYQENVPGKKIGSTIDSILKQLETAPGVEAEEDSPDREAVAEWQQPTGAHDSYRNGEIVLYQNQRWRSLEDNNVWSPTAYPQGWEEV